MKISFSDDDKIKSVLLKKTNIILSLVWTAISNYQTV